MKPFSRAAGAALIAALAAGGCAKHAPATAAGSALTPVTLQTDWYAQPEHGGFYQAQAAGLYRARGLDVTILQGHPNLVPAQTVATGQADFSISRSDDVIVAVSRGIPLVMLGALMEKDPQGVMYHAGQGIHSFRDLNGRNLMAVPGSNFIRILEQTQHLRLRVTPTDFGITRFLADPAMVVQCFVTNEPFYARRQGAAVGVLLLSEGGFSPYRVWFTRRSLVREHPEIVRAFTEASLEGWAGYINGDRRAADARIRELNPRMTPEFVAYSVGAMKEFHLIAGDAAAGDAPGRIDPRRLAEQIRQLRAVGAIDQPVEVAALLP